MAYPATLPSFTVISGTTLVATDDHANRHNTEGSAIVEIATTLGTTGGTNILKDFTAGQFPARVNAGGTIVQTLTGGTINTTTLGTPTITLGSDATGDMYYRGSGTTVSRLGIGTNGQYLTTNGTTPSWGTVASALLSSKIITGTRDLTAATGDVAYTGVGFTPTVVIAFYAINGAATAKGAGYVDSAKNMGAVLQIDGSNNWFVPTTYFIASLSGSSDYQKATLSTFDADGVTLSWTKTGSPTGTLTFTLLCLR